MVWKESKNTKLKLRSKNLRSSARVKFTNSITSSTEIFELNDNGLTISHRTISQSKSLTKFKVTEKTYFISSFFGDTIFTLYLADGVGFEPTVRSHARRFSRPVPSTTRPPIQIFKFNISNELILSSTNTTK